MSLDFDLETGPGRPSSLRLFAEPSFVRELACLVRPPRLAQPATPQPPQPVRCEQSTAHAAVPDRPIRLFAGIGSSVMPASEMLALEAGQVIRLDRLAGELATLSIDGQHLATGEVVNRGERGGYPTHVASLRRAGRRRGSCPDGRTLAASAPQRRHGRGPDAADRIAAALHGCPPRDRRGRRPRVPARRRPGRSAARRSPPGR
ncbi:MAG: FliM/FliN family flagellar motor switch protein [Candidatus Wallbacteria bacterium]|nr:FliM/FliN family flagellar motor switch protein [Candidatus Wallbacteria bacterium]